MADTEDNTYWLNPVEMMAVWEKYVVKLHQKDLDHLIIGPTEFQAVLAFVTESYTITTPKQRNTDDRN